MDRKIQSRFEEKIDLNQIPVAVVITDESGIVIKLNRHAKKMANGRWRQGSSLSDFLNVHKTRTMIGGETFNVTFSPFRQGEVRGAIYVFQSLENILQEESEIKVREASEMVAEIAHEIRNPLGSIELFASLLRKAVKGERELNRASQIILSVKAINERISELLRHSKKRALRKQTLFLNRLIRDILIMPGQTESFLAFQMTGSEMPIEGDENMLRQMFLNVLIQLLQITPPEVRLSVGLTRSIRDDRPYAEVTFMCEGEASMFKNYDLVLGLNLAIIHNIILMHNGIVNIGSNAISILLPMVTP
jgi:nitrogen fixation/metabolism regulation signal transduction histidine kinase